jgi:hypothetical protein
VGVRSAFALLLLLLAAPVQAQDAARPENVAVGPVTLQIVETASGEKELRHGARVLLKDFSVSAGIAAKFKDVDARVIEVGPGGNACEGWPAVVTVKDGKVAADTTMNKECASFAASADEQGFTFVESPQPGTDGSAWRFTPNDGMRRLGVLVFQPQPGTTWADLTRMLDHPLALFNVAPFDAAVRKLTGAQFRDFAQRLHLASGVERKGNFLVGTGCQAHACNSDRGFIGIDPNARAVFLAMRSNTRVTTWPALASWPILLRGEYEAWRKP